MEMLGAGKWRKKKTILVAVPEFVASPEFVAIARRSGNAGTPPAFTLGCRQPAPALSVHGW